MKTLTFVIVIFFSTHAFADLSTNINVTDNYIYRGVSNSNNDPAIQGGVDYFNDASMYYAGVWATTMDFQYPDGNPNYEFDMYAGITGKLAKTNWELGFLRFTYPNGASKYKLDSHEFHLGLSRSYDYFGIAVKYHYSPDYSGAGESHYLEAKIDVALLYDFNLTLHAGHQRFENNSWYGLPDYTDWRVAVGRDIAGFNVELGWTDTNVSNQQACFGGAIWCQSTVNINIRKDFQLF